MAKTSASATLSPLVLSTGNGIYKQHVQSVIEQCNYSAGRNSDALAVFETGIGGAFGTWTHASYFTTSRVTVYVINFWIDPDLQAIDIETVATLAAGQTGTIWVTVGGWTATHTHAAASTTTQTSSPTTAASPTGVGTGWQTITIEMQKSSGATAGTSRLDSIRIEGRTITAANLPDPANE